MSVYEQGGARLHITKHSRKDARGKSSDLIPLTAGARAGTTPIRWVRAPPGRRALRVHLIGVANDGSLGERPCGLPRHRVAKFLKIGYEALLNNI